MAKDVIELVKVTVYFQSAQAGAYVYPTFSFKPILLDWDYTVCTYTCSSDMASVLIRTY